MPVKWIEHKGKKILYCDMRNLSPEGITAIMKETDVLILESPGKILYLGNVEGAAVNREVMQEARRLTSTSRRNKFEKMAAVGVKGVKNVLMTALVTMFDKSGVQIRSFETEEEALKWLVG